MSTLTYETFTRLGLLGRRWYFRVRSKNGQIVAQSEAYNSKRARDDTVDLMIRDSGGARILDVEN